MADEQEETINFMRELADLCKKYKRGISSCGCCDGPWITAEEREAWGERVIASKDGMVWATVGQEKIQTDGRLAYPVQE